MSFVSLLDEGKIKEAKLALRNTVLSQDERKNIWKKILDRNSDTQLDTETLFWETVDTCYGTRDLIRDTSRLPGCVDTSHCHVYTLSAEDQGRVTRVVTVMAYNCPDIPYIPLVYPVSALLLMSGMSEEETYFYITSMVAPCHNINYFTQTKGGWDILCFSLKPLAQKYIVS